MAAALAFNGGRLQLNFNQPNGNTGEYPFLNLLKCGGTAQYVTGGNGGVIPTDQDAQGYPNVIKNGGQYHVCFIPSQAARPGRYVVTAQGGGVIFVTGTTTGAIGSKTLSGGSCRYEFTPHIDGGIYNIGIESISPKITDLKFFHIDDEPLINAGVEVFGTKFKERLIEANFGALRFLNWMWSNGSGNVTTWATRKPENYITWGGQELRSAIYAGDAANSGNDYAFTFGVGAPTDKLTVTFRMTAQMSAKSTVSFTGGVITWTAHGLSVNNPVAIVSEGTLPTGLDQYHTYYVKTVPDANTITISATPGGTAITIVGTGSGSWRREPTINLNSTGAKPAKTRVAATFGNGDRPAANAVVSATWDADLDEWMIFGGGGNSYLDNGVPPEICVRLCAEMGAHPWFTTYSMACDPATDYNSSLAAYVRDSGPAWMIPRFEGLNELWNTNQVNTHYAIAKALSYGWTSDTAGINNMAGRTMTQLGKAVSTVYSDDRDRYQVVCGVITVAFSSLPITSQDPRLTSALYVTETGDPTDAAKLWVTHIAPSQYSCPYVKGTGTETTLATAYAGGDLTAPATYIDYITSGTSSQFASLAYLTLRYTNVKAWAAGHGVMGMCGYEGGYSPDYGSSGVGNVDLLRGAGKLVTSSPLNANGLLDITVANWENFIAAGGEFPSVFQMGGSVVSSNVWAVLEDIYQSPTPPQWEAARLFNTNKRRLKIIT